MEILMEKPKLDFNLPDFIVQVSKRGEKKVLLEMLRDFFMLVIRTFPSRNQNLKSTGKENANDDKPYT